MSERRYTNFKSSSEFIKWFKVQVTQRYGPLSARKSDQKKGTTLLQNILFILPYKYDVNIIGPKVGEKPWFRRSLIGLWSDISLATHLCSIQMSSPCVGKLLPISESESETVLLPSRFTHTRNLLWCGDLFSEKLNKKQ